MILAGLLFIASFAVSSALTAVVRRFSLKLDFTAKPSADRYHKNVIPLGGGIAIFWAMLIVIASAVIAVKILAVPTILKGFDQSVTMHIPGFMQKIPELAIMSGCALVLHILGLWDDIKKLSPWTKLIVEFAAAFCAAYFADIRLELFIHNRLITSAMSSVWIVLLINSFNFLDNMDGLSAGIAVIASALLLTAATVSGQLFIGSLSIVFIGTLMGFLVFNFPPASIFMGDCGSIVVGFFIAVLTLKTTYYHQDQAGGLFAVFLPLVVMAVPMYDFISVTILRISQGKSPFVGDTQHFSHRLKRRGLSDKQTALTLYLATLCTGLGGIFLYQVNFVGAVLVFSQTVMILLIIAILEKT